MEKACIGFKMRDASEAYRHMDLMLVEEYGSSAYGNIKLQINQIYACDGLDKN